MNLTGTHHFSRIDPHGIGTNIGQNGFNGTKNRIFCGGVIKIKVVQTSQIMILHVVDLVVVGTESQIPVDITI